VRAGRSPAAQSPSPAAPPGRGSGWRVPAVAAAGEAWPSSSGSDGVLLVLEQSLQVPEMENFRKKQANHVCSSSFPGKDLLTGAKRTPLKS
jgi:hypothetical protein